MSNHEGGGCGGGKWSRWSLKARIGVIAAAVVLIPALFTLFAAVTMWLWNWLMPVIFKLPVIGFWQAVGILILSHILFKGGRVGRMGRGRWKKARVQDQMRDDAPEPKAN